MNDDTLTDEELAEAGLARKDKVDSFFDEAQKIINDAIAEYPKEDAPVEPVKRYDVSSRMADVLNRTPEQQQALDAKQRQESEAEGEHFFTNLKANLDERAKHWQPTE